MNLNQVTLPATNIAASVAFYRQLGFVQIVAAEHYARFECGEGDATFSLHQAAHISESAGVVIYFEATALDVTVMALKKQGVVFYQDPQDEPWLWREARLKDPSGNVICLYSAGENRKNPPWRIDA